MVRVQSPPRWLLASVISALLLVVLGVAGLAWLGRKAPEPLPALGRVPEFHLLDQQGRPFAAAGLRGKFTAVGFIYTSCPDICPMLTSKMVSLQTALQAAGLADEVQLLSISVDPERDTPEVLAGYARDRGASWPFLTGSQPEVEALVTRGFRVGYEKTAHAGHGPSAAYEVSHSGKIVLVDPRGEIRAYYDGEQLDPAHVIADIQKLR